MNSTLPERVATVTIVLNEYTPLLDYELRNTVERFGTVIHRAEGLIVARVPKRNLDDLASTLGYAFNPAPRFVVGSEKTLRRNA